MQTLDICVQVEVLKPVEVLRWLSSEGHKERCSSEERAEAERRMQYEELIERRVVANVEKLPELEEELISRRVSDTGAGIHVDHYVWFRRRMLERLHHEREQALCGYIPRIHSHAIENDVPPLDVFSRGVQKIESLNILESLRIRQSCIS